MDSFITTLVKDFLYIAGTITIGFGIASWITALLTPKDWDVVYTETETEREKYEKKFEEEFSRLNVHNLNKEEQDDFKHSACIEECPRGKVIMRYNLEEETFEYFTNSRNIPHNYLDVVARKFIIENDCKIIYKLEIESNDDDVKSNNEENDEESDNDGKEEHEESSDKNECDNEEHDEEEETSVFATFKKTEEAKKTPLIVKVINKYKSVGTIDDYERVNLQNQTNTGEEKVIKLTFKDYKNMVEKSEKQ